MKYLQLPQIYIDDTIAEALYAREVEFFHYDFDRKNYVAIIEAMPDDADAAYRADMQKRIDDTLLQMGYVELIYAALLGQITDPAAHVAAVTRTTAKRIAKADTAVISPA